MTGQARRRFITGFVAIAAVAGGGGAVAVTKPFTARPAPRAPGNSTPVTLATVELGTLTARTQVNGTLEYSGSFSIVNQATGTFTTLPRVGHVLRPGQILYRVSARPVLFLYGKEPAYRSLAQGDKGSDVRQLNASLVEMGFRGKSYPLSPRSKKFDWRTVRALKKLQKTLGLTRTGKLAHGDAVFLPTRGIRLSAVDPTLGTSAGPGMTVMKATSLTRYVSVDLATDLQPAVKVGNKVSVILPDGKRTPGVVTHVGSVVTKAEGGGSSTVDVNITLPSPRSNVGLDKAPVQVVITTERVDNALSVPVNALVALAGGGYAVEEVSGKNSRRLIPVEVGLFDEADGLVQVTGTGLAAGQRVVVPTI